MLNPSRIKSLLVCTLIGAVGAYVFGVQQVRSRLENELSAPWAPSSPAVPMAGDQINSGSWAIESPDLPQPSPLSGPNFEPPEWVDEDETAPRLASESSPGFSQLPVGTADPVSYVVPMDALANPFVVPHEPVSNTPDSSYSAVRDASPVASEQPNAGLMPTDDVYLIEVPDTIPHQDTYVSVSTAEYVVPTENEPLAVDRIGVEGTESIPDTTGEFQASQPLPLPIETSDKPLRITYGAFQTEQAANADSAETGSTSEDESCVVYNASGSRPMLTLKIGRTESRQMSAAELNRAEPIRPALPAFRGATPQASLFVEVNETDRTCAVRAQHVKLRDLLTTLGERAGIWISATQHVGGLVSTDIADVRIEEAIEEIAGPLGYSVGVRDNAILVGLHDEVRGYERRLNDFASFDKARIAVRMAESQQLARVQQARDREFQLRQARAEQAQRGKMQMKQPRIEALADRPAAHGQRRPEIALVSHTEAFRSPAKVRTSTKGGNPTARTSVGNETSRAVPGEPVAQALPMHAGPARGPSSERILEARRVKIASEEGKVISVIAERALNHIKDGEYRRVVNMLTQLVTEHQNSAQLFQLLGEAYYHCDQFNAAEYSLEHSLKLYKNDARTNYFLGCVLAQQGIRQRSLHYLLQAHDIDPMYPPIVSKNALAPR